MPVPTLPRLPRARMSRIARPSGTRHPTPWKGSDRHNDLIDLLGRILERSARLPGCACIGMGHVFDFDSGDRIAAQAVCQRCPARQACESWADGLPRGYVGGVVGGQYRQITRKPERQQA